MCVVAETCSMLEDDATKHVVRWSYWISDNALLVTVLSCCSEKSRCCEMSRWCYVYLVRARVNCVGGKCSDHATLDLSNDDHSSSFSAMMIQSFTMMWSPHDELIKG